MHLHLSYRRLGDKGSFLAHVLADDAAGAAESCWRPWTCVQHQQNLAGMIGLRQADFASPAINQPVRGAGDVCEPAYRLRDKRLTAYVSSHFHEPCRDVLIIIMKLSRPNASMRYPPDHLEKHRCFGTVLPEFAKATCITSRRLRLKLSQYSKQHVSLHYTSSVFVMGLAAAFAACRCE